MFWFLMFGLIQVVWILVVGLGCDLQDLELIILGIMELWKIEILRFCF